MNKETKHLIFQQWADNCPHAEYLRKARKIREVLCINTAIYSNWLRGVTEIPDMAIKPIEKITGIKF